MNDNNIGGGFKSFTSHLIKNSKKNYTRIIFLGDMQNDKNFIQYLLIHSIKEFVFYSSKFK